MGKIIQNTKTLLTTPGMLQQWLRWCARLAGVTPSLPLPLKGELVGFRSFSEFWSAREMIPDQREINFILKFGGHSGVILDVGANLGSFALTLATLRGECDVHAFEPSPQTYEKLRANVKLNKAKNIHVHQLALSDKAGVLKFDNNQNSPGTNCLIELTDCASGESIDVEVGILDDFLDAKGSLKCHLLRLTWKDMSPTCCVE